MESELENYLLNIGLSTSMLQSASSAQVTSPDVLNVFVMICTTCFGDFYVFLTFLIKVKRLV